VWADVALISTDRWNRLSDYLAGAPDLAVEVLSLSNTAAEINDKEQLCLANGSIEFWTVDPKLRIIKVATRDAVTRTYTEREAIPLTRFGGAALQAADVFSVLD
jgi:Uma2 family endonuclease